MEVIEFNLALIFVMKFISSITKDFTKLTLSKCIKTKYPISNKVSVYSNSCKDTCWFLRA